MLREALVEMRRSLELAPNVQERNTARIWIARTWLLVGYPGEALAELSLARAQAPEDPRLDSEIARATLRLRLATTPKR